ncbi:sigma-70 family RNA polymerase sigma factor [soil metagenome]
MAEQSKYTESELVGALAQGDKQAFSYLYDNYAPAMMGIIFKMVEDKELAEDILQEAFIKVWNNFASYDASKGRLFTWMVNLVKNLTIDTLRSKGFKNQKKIQGNEESVTSIRDQSGGIEKFDSMGIRKQLANLNEDQKNIIDMAYFGGLTQDEISKQLAIPLGTVKTRTRSAILQLRKLLQYQ